MVDRVMAARCTASQNVEGCERGLQETVFILWASSVIKAMAARGSRFGSQQLLLFTFLYFPSYRQMTRNATIQNLRPSFHFWEGLGTRLAKRLDVAHNGASSLHCLLIVYQFIGGVKWLYDYMLTYQNVYYTEKGPL